MPRFDDNMEINNTGNANYQYSAVKIDKLAGESSEFTLVSIVIDITGSVFDFADELLLTMKSIIKAEY